MGLFRYWLLAAVLFLSLAVPAFGGNGGVKIIGTYEGFTDAFMRDSGRVMIERFYNGVWETIDSPKLKNGALETTLSANESFLFRFKLASYRPLEAAFSATDSIFEYSTNPTLIQHGNYDASVVMETAMYHEAKRIYSAFMQEKGSLESQIQFLSHVDSFYNTHKASLETGIQTARLAVNQQLLALSTQYPDAVLAKTLIPCLIVPVKKRHYPDNTVYDNETAFYHDHFFDNLDFSQPLLTSTPFFKDRINDYFKNYVQPDSTGYKEGFRILLSKPEMNAKVKDYLVSMLLKQTVDMRMLDLADYMVQQYGGGCSDNARGAYTKYLKAAKRPNNTTAPEIVMKNEKGAFVSLDEQCKKNKLTILDFWMTGCIHCTLATDKLNGTLKNYSRKGVQIFAVSLDTDKDAWATSVAQSKSSWVNVCDQRGWGSETLNQYNIVHTPTLFILDKDRNILADNITVDELDSKLKELLAK